jgi:hypothetical protein
LGYDIVQRQANEKKWWQFIAQCDNFMKIYDH